MFSLPSVLHTNPPPISRGVKHSSAKDPRLYRIVDRFRRRRLRLRRCASIRTFGQQRARQEDPEVEEIEMCAYKSETDCWGVTSCSVVDSWAVEVEALWQSSGAHSTSCSVWAGGWVRDAGVHNNNGGRGGRRAGGRARWAPAVTGSFNPSPPEEATTTDARERCFATPTVCECVPCSAAAYARACTASRHAHHSCCQQHLDLLYPNPGPKVHRRVRFELLRSTILCTHTRERPSGPSAWPGVPNLYGFSH